MKKIKIGIVDDNQDFCEVVMDYLNKQNNIEVIFTAPDGIKAIEYLEKIKLTQDPIMFFGLLVSQALKDYQKKQGRKEKKAT